MDPFEQLPEELVYSILRRLQTEELANCSLVCTRFYRLVRLCLTPYDKQWFDYVSSSPSAVQRVYELLQLQKNRYLKSRASKSRISLEAFFCRKLSSEVAKFWAQDIGSSIPSIPALLFSWDESGSVASLQPLKSNTLMTVDGALQREDIYGLFAITCKTNVGTRGVDGKQLQHERLLAKFWIAYSELWKEEAILTNQLMQNRTVLILAVTAQEEVSRESRLPLSLHFEERASDSEADSQGSNDPEEADNCNLQKAASQAFHVSDDEFGYSEEEGSSDSDGAHGFWAKPSRCYNFPHFCFSTPHKLQKLDRRPLGYSIPCSENSRNSDLLLKVVKRRCVKQWQLFLAEVASIYYQQDVHKSHVEVPIVVIRLAAESETRTFSDSPHHPLLSPSEMEHLDQMMAAKVAPHPYVVITGENRRRFMQAILLEYLQRPSYYWAKPSEQFLAENLIKKKLNIKSELTARKM